MKKEIWLKESASLKYSICFTIIDVIKFKAKTISCVYCFNKHFMNKQSEMRPYNFSCLEH